MQFPEMLEYAENLFRRFPEEFILLGAPQLEDHFVMHKDGGWRHSVVDTESAKVIEIVLPRRLAGDGEGPQAPLQEVCQQRPPPTSRESDIRVEIGRLNRALENLTKTHAECVATEVHRQLRQQFEMLNAPYPGMDIGGMVQNEGRKHTRIQPMMDSDGSAAAREESPGALMQRRAADRRRRGNASGPDAGLLDHRGAMHFESQSPPSEGSHTTATGGRSPTWHRSIQAGTQQDSVWEHPDLEASASPSGAASPVKRRGSGSGGSMHETAAYSDWGHGAAAAPVGRIGNIGSAEVQPDSPGSPVKKRSGARAGARPLT